MAYTIVKSDGTVLTTIAEGTINTTSTSMGLPGRNYAGYGQALDTNFVHQMENFASATPPSNPLRGQLWFDTNTSTLKVCPTDGEIVAANWITLASTSSGGTTTFGSVTVTGTLTANNISITNEFTGNAITVSYATVSANANISDASISSANIGTLTTANITTGSVTNTGNITGVWTINGSAGGAKADAIVLNTGGIYISNSSGSNLYGIKSDLYMYANGDPISFSGTYSNSNVQSYLPNYAGNLGSVGGASIFNGKTITTGANTTAGSITGNWTLTAGSRWNATYADLAERYEADAIYDVGTVVEIGGEKEITAVKDDASSEVFGVVSDSYAYLLNEGAGDNSTHPAIALIGRIKIKVSGPVSKGQRLVSAGNGIARAAKNSEATAFNVVGRSLVNKTSDGVEIIEATVIIR